MKNMKRSPLFQIASITFTAVSLLFVPISHPLADDTIERASKPRLAVIFVVDQMRADYLTRWSSLYSGGLHRLLSGGIVFTNARHDHAATVTAVGHATIATGAIPAKHGIVGNSFYDRTLKKEIYSVADNSTVIVGDHKGVGASPRRLVRSAVGDWLKKSSPASKVFAASLKDRAAIFMGGKNPDGVFWHDDESGNFVTSSFYAKELPGWVTSFNRSGIGEIWRDSAWTKVNTRTSYQGEDIVLAERGGRHSAFPHPVATKADDRKKTYYKALCRTPFADALLLRFCRDLLISERLGEDTIPDLFMISLSAADIVGHDYGPDSHEIQDYYLRLDMQLGMFLDTLDARLGKDNYIFVLSSDHGVCPLPEVAAANGMVGARRLRTKDFMRDVSAALADAFADCKKNDSLLIPFADGFVIDSAVASRCMLSIPFVEKEAASAIERLDYVANVFTFDQLSADSADSRPYASLFKNSFYPERAVDLIVNFKEGVLLTSSSSGTSHGSPYHYDTDIPIVFYGKSISPWVFNDPVRSVDIAPTIALLLRIFPEAGIDGHILPVIH